MSRALLRAAAVLGAPSSIEGESSGSLASEVNLINRGHPDAKTCTPVPGLDVPLRVRAADALLELARASRNPKDRSVAAAYQWWAFLRYLGYFERSRGYLTVSAEGRSFINNQRRVASEELGVAFSLLVGRRWADVRHGSPCLTSVIDVELALAGHLPGVAQLPGRTRRPDWILAVRDPAAPLRVTTYLLESKGTAGDAHARRQLARAARQLTAVSIGGVVPKGLAVSTVSGKGRIRYLALDPGEEPDPVEIDPEALATVAQEGGRAPRRSHVRRTAEYLASASVYWSLVGLADFARNTGALEFLGARPRGLEETEAPVQGHPTAAGPIDGVERTWSAPGGRLSVVTGVASEISERLSGHDITGALEAQARWTRRHVQSQENGRRPTRSGQDSEAEDANGEVLPESEVEALATSSDGAVLSVRVE